MNRRDFIRGFAGALAGFTILPAATTYERLWKAERVVKPVRYIINPAWERAPYEIVYLDANAETIPMVFPCRLSQVIPDHIFQDEMLYREYVDKHFIPPFVPCGTNYA